MSLKRLSITAMLAAVALIIFIIEAQIPPIIAIPGIKLGLSNIVTLFAIYFLGKREGAAVFLIRVFLGSIFAGQIMSLFFSIVGGVLAFAVMCLFSSLMSEKQIWAVSIFGAIANNIGQLFVAFFVMGTEKIFWYAPVLVISAIITGLFTGICAQLVLKQFNNIRI